MTWLHAVERVWKRKRRMRKRDRVCYKDGEKESKKTQARMREWESDSMTWKWKIKALRDQQFKTKSTFKESAKHIKFSIAARAFVYVAICSFTGFYLVDVQSNSLNEAICQIGIHALLTFTDWSTVGPIEFNWEWLGCVCVLHFILYSKCTRSADCASIVISILPF